MAELGPGLYELLITEGLRAQLDELAERLPVDQRALNSADASDRIAWHVSWQIERALLDVSDERRVEVGLRVARALLDRLGELVQTDPSARPMDPATVLHAILRRRPDGTPAQLDAPLIPLLDTTLLTNAPGEPTLWSQLRSEIDSADEIDVVMAFIRQSGIRPARSLGARAGADDRLGTLRSPRQRPPRGGSSVAPTCEVTVIADIF